MFLYPYLIPTDLDTKARGHLLSNSFKISKTSETADISETTEMNIQHVIGCMAYIHTIKLSPKIKTFGDISINVSDHMNGQQESVLI